MVRGPGKGVVRPSVTRSGQSANGATFGRDGVPSAFISFGGTAVGAWDGARFDSVGTRYSVGTFSSGVVGVGISGYR